MMNEDVKGGIDRLVNGWIVAKSWGCHILFIINKSSRKGYIFCKRWSNRSCIITETLYMLSL